MRILLITNYFPPEIGAASHLYHDLARSLVERGHALTVVTGFPRYNISRRRAGWRLFRREKLEGIDLVRVQVTPFLSGRQIARKIEYFSVMPAFLLGGVLAARHDVAIAYSPPIPVGMSAYMLKKLKGIPFILNVHDIHPQALVDIGFVSNPVLISLLRSMEKTLYREAATVAVHSEGNAVYLEGRGVDPRRLAVLPVWVDLDEIRPRERSNGFRREIGVNEEFLVVFAGTMGTSQDVESIVRAAHRLRDRADIRFALVGDGVEKPVLQRLSDGLGLENVRFHPMQPRERYPDVLAAADVSLVTLKKEVVTPVVPSKLLSAMASGRPVVLGADPNGDAPLMVRAAESGICVPPEDPDSLAAAILHLYADRSAGEAMGRNGRRFVERHYSREVCVARCEVLCERVLAGETLPRARALSPR